MIHDSVSANDSKNIVCFRLNDEIYRKLNEQARAEKRTRSNLVAKIVADYFEEEKNAHQM